MKVNVLRGHSPRDPDKSCVDGDSIYVTGSFENTLFRLMHIDACEVTYLDIERLRASGFLDTLDTNLKRHLEPRLTEKSVKIHKDLALKARTYLDYYLPEELTLTFEIEVFDRYERPLVSVTTRDGTTLYNLKMVETGKAFPYFIYPNAISLTNEGEFNYDTIAVYRDAAITAEEDGKGVWHYVDTILLVKTLGFCDLWIITREKIKIKGEIVIGGPRSDFYVSKAPDRSWEEALKIMRKKVEKFNPKTYRRKGLIQTHWDETVRWDEKDELLYRYFKYDLRKPYDPALRNDQITEWKFHDFLSKLPQCCTIFTQYYPEGLLSYDPYLFKLETDYEDFIIGLFSELPTTSSFFKVSDRLFVHIHVPKEYIRNTDPEVSTTKEYIPLLIRTLIEKGIIKEETHAMCQYHWRKDL